MKKILVLLLTGILVLLFINTSSDILENENVVMLPSVSQWIVSQGPYQCLNLNTDSRTRELIETHPSFLCAIIVLYLKKAYRYSCCLWCERVFSHYHWKWFHSNQWTRRNTTNTTNPKQTSYLALTNPTTRLNLNLSVYVHVYVSVPACVHAVTPTGLFCPLGGAEGHCSATASTLLAAVERKPTHIYRFIYSHIIKHGKTDNYLKCGLWCQVLFL